MNFTGMMAALDLAIEDHLCDDAFLTSQSGGSNIPVRIMIVFPVEIDRLQGMSFTRTRPIVSIAHASVPELREGDTLYVSDDAMWTIASAPTRTGDGRWWQAEIEPYG